MIEPKLIGGRACMHNPALKPLEFLLGDWRTSGTHPLVPGQSLEGRTSFAWYNDGAFIIMRNEVADPRFPDGVAIIGSDDASNRFSMVYFDERGVSRVGKSLKAAVHRAGGMAASSQCWSFPNSLMCLRSCFPVG
ncbi:hypothetical protein HMF7854_11160 [Sphingomonas ginkgonis]|uniref:DUF1794 domain-containing protein n=1 Tax=Sphingomonas ginkgonis TaxID=2315330 RepID=A0A3R9YMT3_9SPHN|nr:hypothetical protein [Sphingomonas ginkgonis]RST31335.1 hypothetical protein HMF7854_11160 [Sphingomonas ginkgonis]